MERECNLPSEGGANALQNISALRFDIYDRRHRIGAEKFKRLVLRFQVSNRTHNAAYNPASRPERKVTLTDAILRHRFAACCT